MNVSDSGDCREKLLSLGLDESESERETDLVLINACVVRAKAEDKAISYLGRLDKLRREESPGMHAVLMGCLTEEMKGRVSDTYPFVVSILPGNDTGSYSDSLEKVVHELELVDENNGGRTEFTDRPPAHKFLPVTRGCANRCAYCIVPRVRGELRSRERTEILAELRQTFDSGVKAVTLLGQNVLAYGTDLSPREEFVNLLRDIGEQGFENRWVFFLTSHPRDLDESVLRAVADYPVFSRFLHLPLQAGDDDVLRRMRRGYSRRRFKEKVDMAREILPDLVLSTDLLVGFPGETEDQFKETLRMAREIRFDSAFTFYYTPREGTESAEWEGSLPHEVKLERVNRLIDVQNAITLKSNRAMIGRKVKVLVDEPSRGPGEGMKGITRENRTVILDGAGIEPGTFVEAEITDANMRLLKGKAIA
jgi:tRNA-2-methylthio-N6-dimethylallyladenosine synthase